MAIVDQARARGFTGINELHGQAVGDAVLVEMGRRLHDSLRPDDTVARLGGDEFVTLCPDVEPEHAPTLIARINNAANARVDVGDQRVTVSSSLGMVVFDDPTETVTDLLRRAHQGATAANESKP